MFSTKRDPFWRAAARQKFIWLRCPVFAARAKAACKKQTAAPAPLRLFRPQDAPQLRSPLVSPFRQNLPRNRALGLRPRTLPAANFPGGVPPDVHAARRDGLRGAAGSVQTSCENELQAFHAWTMQSDYFLRADFGKVCRPKVLYSGAKCGIIIAKYFVSASGSAQRTAPRRLTRLA